MKLAVKLKGVRADARSMDILEDINEKIECTTGVADVADIDLPIAVTKLMTRWSRMGAGTILSSMVKMVRPTLTKRCHDLVQGTSIPFKSVSAFQAAKNIYEERAKVLKKQYRNKTSIERLLCDIKKHPDFVALHNASKLTNELVTSSKRFFKDSIQSLSECRKRYMMRLSKIKYDQLQDRILDLFINDPNVCQLATSYLGKIEMVCYQAVLKKRATSRKGVYDMMGDNSQFSNEQAAKTLAYVLFIHYILVHVRKEIAIPDNFSKICTELSEQFMWELLTDEKI